MKKTRMLALFANFDEAIAAIADIRRNVVPGVTVDDVAMKSPIEHPEIEEVLGERPVYIQRITLFGALFGLIFGFFFLSGAQATFLVQPQGGKPVVPLPSNFVLMYEMLIFGGVWMTFFAFLGLSGLFKKRDALYSEKVSLDQVGIMLQLDDAHLEPIKELFKKHQVLEIREEVAS
jgi:hypothetical protein